MLTLQDPVLSHRDFKSFQALIYDLAGISLADSKGILVQSRLAKRIRTLKLGGYHDYLNLLTSGKSPDEVTQFINALTTNKTDFFRERHHFDYLTKTVFPQLSEQKKAEGHKKLRVWCSASSTGEEPYTIAMTIREFFGTDSSWDIRILASDIDTEVLEVASTGVYSSERFGDVPGPLLHRYFDRDRQPQSTKYRAKSSLRDLITFRRINLQESNWPINVAFDVIFCRNVMIYFNEATQSQLVERFANQLRPEGHLLIGHSETLSGRSQAFNPVGNTIYQLKPGFVSKVKDHSPRAQSSDRPAQLRNPKQNTNQSKVPNQIQMPSGKDITSIIVGEICVGRDPMWVKTVLGSCVATCLYDEKAGIGGMNHFRLPDSNSSIDASSSLGVHAMELLINAIMKAGGDRRRLKAKIFGGGSVISIADKSLEIGPRNIRFAEQFLGTERIPIISRYTGGDVGMQVSFHTGSAKAIVKLLDRSTSVAVDREENRQADTAHLLNLPSNEVTLF